MNQDMGFFDIGYCHEHVELSNIGCEAPLLLKPVDLVECNYARVNWDEHLSE